MDIIVNKILDKANILSNEVAIKKYATRPQFTYFEVVLALVYNKNIYEAANQLGITEHSLEAQLYKYIKFKFPDKKASQNWRLYLLSTIEHKQCYKCDKIDIGTNFVDSKHNYICKSCTALFNKERADKDREAYNLAAKEYRVTNKEKLYSYYHSEQYLTNKQQYRILNSEKYRAYNAKRRAAEKQASYTFSIYDSEYQQIKDFYKNCPDGYHVDHIVPLQNPLVCGLHCIANLQYLTAADNLSKGNKFEIL